MTIFILRKRNKNTPPVSATTKSTSSNGIMSSPSKSTSPSNRFSRFNSNSSKNNSSTTNNNNQSSTTSPAVKSSSSPAMPGDQYNLDETKSYQSFAHSFAHQNRPSPPPLALSSLSVPSQITRTGLRKNRQAPTLNLMVVGAKATGKSTFLHTLLGTFIPNTESVADSLPVTIPSTFNLTERQTTVVNLSGDKVKLNVIDTPGLDILSNDEFRVDLQMNETLRYIESKFDESLHIERQVHRNPTRLGDGHVHISIYFIDPSTIIRRSQAVASIGCASDSNAKAIDGNELHMSSIDLRQLKRLSRRSNVLPVIGRADELTEIELTNFKNVVRSDLRSYGIDLGLFDAADCPSEDDDGSCEHPEVTTASSNSSKSCEDDDGPKKLPRRKSAVLSTARRPSSGFMRSLQDCENVCTMIPLSIVSAEVVPAQSLDASAIKTLNETNPFFGSSNPEVHSSLYVRRFKWATVNVLNPNHCDFVILRAVVLGSHFRKLKDMTRLEKYEKYRTEKLIARRKTMNQGPVAIEEQKKIALEVEKMEIPHIEPAASIFVPSIPTKTPSSGLLAKFSTSGRKKHAASSPPPNHSTHQSVHPLRGSKSAHHEGRHPASNSAHAPQHENTPMVFQLV